MEKKSFFRSLAALALGAFLAVVSLPAGLVTKAKHGLAIARDWLVSVVFAPVQMSQPPAGQVVDRPRVLLVAARAFVARLAQRMRPRVTPGWRLCPSV